MSKFKVGDKVTLDRDSKVNAYSNFNSAISYGMAYTISNIYAGSNGTVMVGLKEIEPTYEYYAARFKLLGASRYKRNLPAWF